MKKKFTHEMFFVAFIVEIYFLIALFYETSFITTNGQLFIIVSVLLTGSVLAYLFGQFFSLYASLIFVAGYGTYLLYLSLIKATINLGSFLIIIFAPIIIITIGSYSSYIKKLNNKLLELEDKINKFVTIDSITGLENITAFNLDLQKQISFARRYGSNLYLMIIEIKYFDELKLLYKQEGIDAIVKQASTLLKENTRLEDNKYKLTEKSFAVVYENIKDSGIDVIKTKLKSTLNEASVKNTNGEYDLVHIEVRLGYLKFSVNIDSSTEFYNLTKKELIYDV